MKSGENWLSCFKEDILRLYKLHIYIGQGQGQITPGDKILNVTERVCYFDHTL